MEHKPLSDLCNVADLVPETPKASLTRRERLERWIQVLDREPGRALNTLHQIEHKPLDARRASRVDNSPLSVAFNDPILRADGLASDRLGDAVEYFELSDEEAHRAFCSCYYGESMTAGRSSRGATEKPNQACHPRSRCHLGRGRSDRGSPVHRSFVAVKGLRKAVRRSDHFRLAPPFGDGASFPPSRCVPSAIGDTTPERTTSRPSGAGATSYRTLSR